jgi:hypothetical protein
VLVLTGSLRWLFAAEAAPPGPPAPTSHNAAELAALEKRKKREAALAKAIQRAETIAESYDGVKVHLFGVVVLLGNAHSLHTSTQRVGYCVYVFAVHYVSQIYPMTGTLTHLLTKAKHLQGQMDGIFVSSRVAQVLSEPGFRALCRDKHSVVAVETAKFLVALRTDTQQALTAKEEELAVQNGFKRIPGARTSRVSLLYTCALLTT